MKASGLFGIAHLFFAVQLSVSQTGAEVLLRDAFSGSAGTPLVGRTSDQGGGVWSNVLTDGSASLMNGTFALTGDGGVAAAGDDSMVSAYLPFNATQHPAGWTLKASVIPNDDVHNNRFFTVAMMDTVDKGILLNVDSGQVIRLSYFAGGSNAGCLWLRVFENGQEIWNTLADRSGSETLSPADEIELSITAYPLYGMIEGRAWNVTGGYELSRVRVGLNTPNLSSMQYAGMSLSFLAGNHPVDPAQITSFSIEMPPDFQAARPLAFPNQMDHPIRFPAFSFDEMEDGSNDVRFPDYLEKHQTAVYIHSPRRSVWDAVRRALPDKMLIEQDAYGGIGIHSEDLENIYPGHCLLRRGTLLTADCGPEDTILHAEDVTRLASSQSYVDQIKDLRSSCLLMYELDEEDRPDWSRAEHIRITAVDPSANTITVERGRLESPARSFQSGRAVIAAHVMFWSNQWHVNLSLDCPRGGPFNMTGAEWYALRKLHRVWVLDADGIEFDVGRWNFGQPESTNRGYMDVDNDRVADFGYINGINSFGLGGQVFFRKLRELLGPEKIIQVDGNDAMNGVRGWQYLNGVQLESFPHANSFDRFSESFIHLRQWVEHVEQPAFSYPFTKTPTSLYGDSYGPGGESTDWRFRVGFATALLTGMPHPFASLKNIAFDPENPGDGETLDTEKGYYVWDENRGGELDDYKWLGRSRGEAVQFLDQLGNQNLLAGTQWEWVTESGFSALNSSASEVYSTEVASIPPNTPQWTSSYYSGTQIPRALWFGNRLQASSGTLPALEPGKEYTLEFEARGNNTWEVYGEVFEKVPRSLMIHGIADYGFQKQASIFLHPDWTFYRFSMIAHSNATPLAFGFSEQIGTAAIRNIRLYEGGAERWSREFERGRVYLNMTLEPWTVNVDTGVVQRLSGSQIPEVHNGQVVNGALTLPARDAVFLRTETYDVWRSKYFSPDILDDFSTGFDGRSAGIPLAGLSVKEGFGSWSADYTDGSRTMNGAMRFAANGAVAETAGTGGGVYVPLNSLGGTVTIETLVTPNDFSPGNFTIGFLEMVDKGFFNNNRSGDCLKLRYIHSGSNAGRFQFDVYRAGIEENAGFPPRSGAEPVQPGDTVRLRLSYRPDDGQIIASAWNVTGGYELCSGALTVSGLTGLRHAGFGWSGIPDQDAAAGGPSAVPGVVSELGVSHLPPAWLEESISGEEADPDGDGSSNFEEYIAGTDPQLRASRFSFVSEFSRGELMLNWSSVSGRVYEVHWTPDLQKPFDVLETGLEWPLSKYASPLPDEEQAGFYRIKVRRKVDGQ
jgi:hypothetical protein